MESVSCAPSSAPNLSCGYFSDKRVTLSQYARPGAGQFTDGLLPSFARLRNVVSWYITITAMICPFLGTFIVLATPIAHRTAAAPEASCGTAAPLSLGTVQFAAAATCLLYTSDAADEEDS